MKEFWISSGMQAYESKEACPQSNPIHVREVDPNESAREYALHEALLFGSSMTRLIDAKEYADLIWFRDEINKRVIPGESDSAESAYALIQSLRRRAAF